MALTAKLKIGNDNKEYLVTDYRWKVACSHNEARPDGMSRCENMEISVVSPGKTDLILMNWYISQSPMDGSILIELINAKEEKSDFKSVAFKNALCYSITEEYHIDRNACRSLRLSLAAESLTVDNIVFTAD